jgi:hypothetical protein
VGLRTCCAGEPGAHQSPNRDRLKKQLELRDSGLVLDPKRDVVDLLFPWGVYEAKKAIFKSTEKFAGIVFSKHAEKQLNHAFQMYLGMLDDLTRDPECPEIYQTGADGPNLQMFGFASSGSLWTVYVAFCPSDREVVCTPQACSARRIF